ncbi:unnamed protein product, partial [Heterosigma akashiwo]
MAGSLTRRKKKSCCALSTFRFLVCICNITFCAQFVHAFQVSPGFQHHGIKNRGLATSCGRVLAMKEEGWFPNPVKAIGKLLGKDKKKDEITTTERRTEPVNDVNSAIDTLLKDAPLPVKLAGGLIKGIAGMAGSMMAETRNDVEEVLDEMNRALRFDPNVQALLGEGAQCGLVLSQSYSSSNINGRVSKQLFLQVQVAGARGAG